MNCKPYIVTLLLLSAAHALFAQTADQEEQTAPPTQAQAEENQASSLMELLSLDDVTMDEAARLISTSTKQPIVVSKAASGVKISIHLRNVSAETALKALCQSSGLWYRRNGKDGVIQVMTAEEFKGMLQFDRSETVDVIQILYPSAKDVGDALAKLYIDRVVWLDPKRNSGDQYSDISRAMKRMDLLGRRGTFDISESDYDSSGSQDYYDEYEDSSRDNRRNEAGRIAKADPAKINSDALESKVAMGGEDSHTDLKINELLNTPGVVFISVLPENNCLMLRSVDSDAIQEMKKLIHQLDKPIPQVLLEVKVLDILLDDGRQRALDFLFSSNDGSISGGFDNGILSAGGGQDILVPTPFEGDDGSGLVPQGSGINKQAAIFNAVNKNFKARLQLLATDERVTALATPNLIVSNNESSALFIGTETTVMEKAQSTTTYNISNNILIPAVSWQIDSPRRKIGTSLLLTPKIHADRTVTLRLLQEKSTLGQQTKNVYSGGSANIGTEEQYFISQDVNLQRIVTTVVGNDQDYMAIGGLIYEEVGKKKERVPVLSDIPLLGDFLFSRAESSRERREVLIIVRPFVMLAPGEAQAVSHDYLEKISQHPVARDDMPNLGVNSPDELAKPDTIQPGDPWLVRMFKKLRGWSVDDSSDFDPDQAMNREVRRKNYKDALNEIERISSHDEEE
jgi:general secretion pathway protein D